MPDVNITIGSVKIPNYNAMIDTGGGMTIIRDTPDGRYIAALKNTLTACPADIDFLQSCQCLPAGQPISVKILGHLPIQYGYNTSDVSQTQTSAVAICPNAAFDRPNSPNPYVFTKGVNLGFNFFNYNRTVSYNIKSCMINVATG